MKVAIIGAGICGLYLSWKLSLRGNKVTVFEKKDKIGNEVCSGLFSQRILQFIPESRNLIQNRINFVMLHFPKKTITLRFPKDSFVMSHFELDRLVADFAQKAGAKIILNHSVSNLPEGFDKIIGCDGANSFVRKKLGLKTPQFRLGIQRFVSKINFSNFVETWPNKNGFIWKIPKGNKIECGIIAKLEEAKIIFDNFLRKNNISLERIHPHTKKEQPAAGGEIDEVSPCFGAGEKSKIIPQGFIIPTHSSITLCGDAAGLTKPWSGGGVVWSLLAANILLKNFPDFLQYQKEMKKFFLPKIFFAKIATKFAHFLGFKIPWLLPSNLKIEADFLI